MKIMGDVVYGNNTVFSHVHEYSPLFSPSINLTKPPYTPLQSKGQRKPETKAQPGGPHRVFRSPLAEPSIPSGADDRTLPSASNIQ